MVYDRAGAAKRIRQRRKELGMTSAEVAGKIGRAVHYYGDIERGTCGMSIETLLDLSHYLDLSVDIFCSVRREKNGSIIRTWPTES